MQNINAELPWLGLGGGRMRHRPLPPSPEENPYRGEVPSESAEELNKQEFRSLEPGPGCVCVSRPNVCVCVRDREIRLSVCVCVCERERERETRPSVCVRACGCTPVWLSISAFEHASQEP